MLLRDSSVAKQVRTVLLDIAGQKGSVEKLERQFQPVLPTPTLKEINEAGKMYEELYGLAYKQQYIQQKLSKFYPSLAGHDPKPEELASLPTAKALLIPTQIGEQVGLFCKSNPKNGSAQQVNKLLEELGYQTRIDGIWSATDKAIDLNLCDRKPVSTGSRTQKDQLLWSADIVPILQEHTCKPL
jgi:hypothetical protein